MTTTVVPVGDDDWTEVGTGAQLIETKQFNNVRLHFGDAKPALETEAHHDLHGPGSFSYGGSQKTYVRAMRGGADAVITEQT